MSWSPPHQRPQRRTTPLILVFLAIATLFFVGTMILTHNHLHLVAGSFSHPHALLESEEVTRLRAEISRLKSAAKGGRGPATVNDFLRRMNYQGAVQASRGGSRIHDLFKPDIEAILFDKRTHPRYNVVIDVGAYDGLDIAYPAYQNGYTVVAFELDTETQQNIIRNWGQKGLVRDTDFRVIDVSEMVDAIQSGTNADATQFLPLNDGNIRLFLVKAGASDKNKRISVRGSGTTAQVDENVKGNNFLVEIDRLVTLETSTFLLKTDAEGHDGRALYGAQKLLEGGNVYTVTLEFRPRSIREHGTDPVELLEWLWDRGVECYDMNTHPGYEPDHIPLEQRGLGRPSDARGFVAWLDKVPLSSGPAGDALGGWEDLICSCQHHNEDIGS